MGLNCFVCSFNHSPNSCPTSIQLQFALSFILLQTQNKKVCEFRRVPSGLCYFCAIPFPLPTFAALLGIPFTSYILNIRALPHDGRCFTGRARHSLQTVSPRIKPIWGERPNHSDSIENLQRDLSEKEGGGRQSITHLTNWTCLPSHTHLVAAKSWVEQE